MSNFEESLRKAGEEILEKIGLKSAGLFSHGGGLPISGKVTDRTGRLYYSVLGGSQDSIRETIFSGDTVKYIIGSKVPYAAIQEKGGQKPVTAAMRKFFWAKYLQGKKTGDPQLDMWSALRFANVLTYPARPFLAPAVYDVAVEIPEILKRYTMEYLKLTITETISEYKN